MSAKTPGLPKVPSGGAQNSLMQMFAEVPTQTISPPPVPTKAPGLPKVPSGGSQNSLLAMFQSVPAPPTSSIPKVPGGGG